MEIAIKTILVLFLLAINGILFYSIFRGAPFAPTNPNIVKKMVALVKVRPGDKAVDIGSGDGRLVIALARAGAVVHGYEINPILVWWSRLKIKRAGLQDRAFIHRRSFWNEDFSQYNIITIFGMSHIMKKLSAKLQGELPSDARVVCNTFSLPNWPDYQKLDRIYLYNK
ncbi:hypothetical protein KKC88_03025 [Patescibacteria group bacterium]|nr:hypothetical protein [Patescibacteria group bacterium]MBU1673470.1 hypothetical protein [Patescibacteria group bacterium]MBU1962908.1 hypothetical protein [Patescibacteria group bacterium]